MWELDHKEGWAPKNWCFWTVVLEKTPMSPLDSKDIKEVNPKENQLWILIGRTDAEAPVLWLPDAKNKLIGKYPDAGKDWEGGNREWDGCMASPNQGTKIWENWEIMEDRGSWHVAVHVVTKHWTQLSNWTMEKRNVDGAGKHNTCCSKCSPWTSSTSITWEVWEMEALRPYLRPRKTKSAVKWDPQVIRLHRKVWVILT